MDVSKEYYQYFFKKLCNYAIAKEFADKPIPKAIVRNPLGSKLWKHELYEDSTVRGNWLGQNFQHKGQNDRNLLYKLFLESKKLPPGGMMEVDSGSYYIALIYMDLGQERYPDIRFHVLFVNERLDDVIERQDVMEDLHQILFQMYLTEMRDNPPPDEHFHYYSIGKFEIPISIVASSFDEPYRQGGVVIHFKDEFFEDGENYPPELRSAKQRMIDYAVAKHGVKHFKDNPLYRIDDVDQEAEDERDNRGDLVLHFSKTRYGNLLATNMALEALITENTTVRQKYGFRPYNNLGKSVMSNPIGIECILISNDVHQVPQRQVILKKRDEEKVNFYRGYYQASASGYMGLDHVDINRNPSPFVTASKETIQEVSHLLTDANPDDFIMLAIAVHWHSLYPNAVGYFNTSRPAHKLLGDPCRDGFEGSKEAIPFTIESVLLHIARNNWTPMSAFAMIAVLCAEFSPAEVEKVAKNLPKGKILSDFKIN